MPMSPRLLRPQAAGGALESEVAAFAAASGATSLSGINALARYLKQQSLFSAARFYPMKSSQNAGTGSTVYGLGGLTTENLTLVNSPTWGATGITFTPSTSHSGSVSNFPTHNIASGTLVMARIIKASASTSDTFGSTNPQSLVALATLGDNSQDSYHIRVIGGKLNLVYRNSANNDFLDARANSHSIGTADVVVSSLSGTSSNRLFLNALETGYDVQDTGASRAIGATLLVARSASTASPRRFDGVISIVLVIHAVCTESQLATINGLVAAL